MSRKRSEMGDPEPTVDRTGTDEEGPLVLGGKEVRAGDQLGAYVFEREVGSGGMARVLLVRNADGEQLALKLLRASRLETGLARFRREFHALSRLDHPNIVRVFSYGDLHGHPYIAMEYVDGPDLHQVIRGFRTWDDARRYKRCEEILIDLCRALAAIHRRGLIHRDLKPSNILLSKAGVCKLSDFGIVKHLDPSMGGPDLSTTLVGTWAYTSPEHISGEPIDHRSDLYSLGVILFAMLTGKRPFVAEGMAGYLDAHRDKPAPKATHIRPTVPPHLNEICDRLLAKVPRDRFQSAREILYRLEADDPDVAGQGQSGWEPPLVGNHDALETVEEAVSALTDGRGGVIQILADDGLGKSRVLAAAVDRARMLGIPFHLHEFGRNAPGYGTTIRLAKELLRELPEEDVADLRPIVAAWTDGTAVRGDTRYTLYDGMRSALAALLTQRPRVVLLDDLHEAHAHEIDLYRYLARHLLGADAPLLMIVTGRPTSEAGAQTWHQGLTPTAVRLSPLSREDVEILVASLLGPGRAASTLAQRLHTETDGNAYFVTEFLKSLVGQGLITHTPAGWQLAVDPGDLAAGHLEIPPSIRQVLRTRLDDVPPAARDVLEALAIAGEPTELDVLLDVLDLDEEPMLQQIDALLGAGLAREHRAGNDLSYDLVHRKLADLLRRDLPNARARGLHRAFATALEATGRQDPTQLETIGQHYRRAGDAGRAYEHLVVAARRLVDRSMPEEAWQLTEHAAESELAARADLDNERFLDLRTDFLHARGQCLRHQGAWEDAVATYRELEALAEERQDARASVEARVGLSHALRLNGHRDAALTAAQEALATARQQHNRKGVTEALHAWTGVAWAEGDLEQVESLADEGLLITQGPSLASQRAALLMARSAAQATRGQLASATRGMAEAESLFDELRMKPQRVIALSNLAELHLWQGETDEAFNRADEAVRQAEPLGYALGLCAALRARGQAAIDLGRYGAAHVDLYAALSTARRLAMHDEIIAASVALTRLSLEQGDNEGAMRHGSAALAATEIRDPERYLPLLHALLARAIAPRRVQTAWVLLQAVEDALPTMHTPRRLQAELAAAWAWYAVGDKTKATQLAREVIRTPVARSFRLINLEARALLASTTTGEEARKHRRIGADLAREFAESLPVQTSEELRRRPIFRSLQDEPPR